MVYRILQQESGMIKVFITQVSLLAIHCLKEQTNKIDNCKLPQK